MVKIKFRMEKCPVKSVIELFAEIESCISELCPIICYFNVSVKKVMEMRLEMGKRRRWRCFLR